LAFNLGLKEDMDKVYERDDNSIATLSKIIRIHIFYCADKIYTYIIYYSYHDSLVKLFSSTHSNFSYRTLPKPSQLVV